MAVDYRSGDYRVVADRLRPAAAQLVELAGVQDGDVVVDVAAGSGNVAHLCTARGGRPVAVDLVREQLQLGREAGPGVHWVQGDAHALPLRDGVGDAVLSTFGVVYATRPDDAVRELGRVCRPGGVVGLTAWPEEGWQAAQARVVEELTGARSPGHDHLSVWGTPAALRARLSPVGDVAVHEGELVTRAESVEAWWDKRSASAPMVLAARAQLDDAGFAELGRRTCALAEQYGEVDADGLVLRDPYLVAVVRRR